MFRFRALSKGSSGEAEVRSGYRLLMVGMRGAEGRRGSEVEVYEVAESSGPIASDILSGMWVKAIG
jgi:hypothetical protein